MKKLDRTGEIHITNEGYSIEIIIYNNKRDCTIKFQNGVIIKNREYKDIVDGRIKNPYHPSVYGVGYYSIGKYVTKIKSIKQKNYQTWVGMLQRGYSQEYKDKFSTYQDVRVCEEWHNFQNFAKWYEENYVEGFVLDKDILFKGNKIYSPETCCFVPQEINSIFIKSKNNLTMGITKRVNKFIIRIGKYNTIVYLGTYNTFEEAFVILKKEKEKYIKEVAEVWKSKISFKIYEAMLKYEV